MSKKKVAEKTAEDYDSPIASCACQIRDTAKVVEAISGDENLTDCEHAALNIMAYCHDLLWAIKDEREAREMAVR